MLRLVLDRGPDAAIPPESMFLADFAAVRRTTVLADPAKAERFMRSVWEHPKVRLWALPGGPPSVPRALPHEEAYRFAVEAPYRSYARKFGKARFGDKTPPYVHHIEDLLAVWPDARFVVMVRDGRDVAVSVRPLPFGPNNAWAAADWWARGIRAGAEAQRAHPREVITVRYEDLVADPAIQVRRICDFLDLAYHDDMLAIDQADRSKIVADQAAWFPTLWNGVNASAVGRWRTEMSVAERQVFESVAGEELRALGYECDSAASERPSEAKARLYHLHNEALRAVNFVRLRVFQERGRELRRALGRKAVRGKGAKGAIT
jgi:Sulfotransferase family